MRMKFLRILPETWARTSWFVSSFTLNMAFGNVSTTVAMTSIASSFDKLYPLLGRFRAPEFWTENLAPYSVRTFAPVSVTATVCSK